MKRCSGCREEKLREAFGRNRATRDGLQNLCRACRADGAKRWPSAAPEKAAARAKRWASRLKVEVIAAYGGACGCCGEREPDFLTVDHVNGEGRAEDRHPGGEKLSGAALYLHVKRAGFPARYRVLCWNCNAAIGLFGSCPHERRLKAVI